MKHPNQSFIDSFNRPNSGPEGLPTYLYSQNFIENKRKQKFECFVESLNKPKPKTNTIAEEINRIFSYNTLSKNTNKVLLETKQSIGSLPQQFNYNGLVYVFNKKLNMFVNQHGHAISIEQATAFMEMSQLEEIGAISSEADTDGGAIPQPVTAIKPTLIIMLGESNSGGLARNIEAPTNELNVRYGINILNNNSFEVETLNIGSTGNNLLGHYGIPDVTSSVWNGACGPPHGWELGLANKVDQNAFNNSPIYILKAGQGGSTIGDWNIGGSYWNTFVNRYNTIISQIPETPNVYIWYELGINDCINNTNINTWKDGLVNHFANIRQTIGISAPIFMTLLPDVGTAGSPISGISSYNNIIRGISAYSPLAYWVKTDDAAMLSDQIVTNGDIYNWNYYGMKKIAYRMVDMCVNLIGLNSTYSTSLNNPPQQPQFNDENPLWAVVPYSGSRPYLGAGRENIFLGAQITGRLSANPQFDELNGGLDPISVINYLNQKGVPEAKRLVFAANLGASNAESYWITQGISYDGCINIGDAVISSDNSVVRKKTADYRARTLGVAGNSSWGGTFGFMSPWKDASNLRMKNWWTNWLNDYKNYNGKSFIFLSDNESAQAISYFSPLFFRYDNDNGITEVADRITHLSYISQDPRFGSTGSSAGNAFLLNQSLFEQLKLNQGYTLSDFNVANLYDGQTAGYLLWDYVNNRLDNYYAQNAFANPVLNIFPNSRATHIRSKFIEKTDYLSDYNGHKSYYDQVIGGNACEIHFGWLEGAGSVYEVNESDPTRLSYNAGIGNTWGVNAWNALLLNQQSIRAIHRNTQNERLHLWIGNKGFIQHNAFGGANDANHDSLWLENIYHHCLHNPEVILLFYPYTIEIPNFTIEDNDTLDILNRALVDVNTLTNNKIITTQSSSLQKINLNTKILITGCQTKNGTLLWRITGDVKNIQNINIGDQTYSINSSNPGFWYTTNQSISSIYIDNSSYDPITKTIYLIPI
jgi:hypothetical protein